MALTALAQPASSSDATCFGDQIKHAQAARIARNSVFIARVRVDGTLIASATGFVVQGRDGARIVTALHAVEPDGDAPDSAVMVFFADGMQLGVPRIAVAAPVQKISVADVDLTVNDLALLEIAEFGDSATRQRFAALDGLPVRAVDRPLLVGETVGTTGVSWGYSGAPAVDKEGRVVGVLTGADFRGRVKVNLATVQTEDGRNQLDNKGAVLPGRSLVVVEPLRSPEMLRELRATPARDDSSAEIAVVFAGFPFANCASTAAQLHAADSNAGTASLKKWQSMDQAGAWWMPPPFSITKLNFSLGDPKARAPSMPMP